MASAQQVASLTEDLTCPICLNIFTDPVSPKCGHNFCRSCITQSWDKDGTNSCPKCREEFPDRTLIVNWALSSLAEKTQNLNLNQKEKESKLQCEKHQEQLKLFCETDKKLICLICRDAREHRDHRFIPIEEAVEKYKARMKSSIESLTEKNSEIQEMEQMQKTKISGVRAQSRSLQSHITSHFNKKRQILAEEEQRLLKDLREAEVKSLDIMEKNLQAIQEKLNSMQEKLTKLQEQMDEKHSVIFLMEEISRKRRISDEELTLSIADGSLEVAKFDNPFLLNRVFSKMSCGIPQVSVTLDVETASPWLEVSEDRKRVRMTKTGRSLPDTGKRFTNCACVLGSEGFTSGRHYWEVEVAGSDRWSLGVAAESVERKRLGKLSLETGVWSIEWLDDEFDASTSPPSPLPAHHIPGRVGVYLSYESGTVSFYDADTKSHLHTFTGNKFTEKLYPFFGPWDVNQWLRICSGSAPGVQKGRVPGPASGAGLRGFGAETRWTTGRR